MTTTTPRSEPRRGSETSETRFALLDATETIMREDGYAAVSSRRVAKEAGVTAALVHYYFGTLDDLFIAVLDRRAAEQFGRIERTFASDRPLHELWEFSLDPGGTALLMEFMALANHRDAFKARLAQHTDTYRARQIEALTAYLDRIGADDLGVPPEVMVMLLAGVSRTLVLEDLIGIDRGLDETRAFVSAWLDRIEPKAAT